MPQIGVQAMLTAGDIELPAMPGAGDDAPRQNPFAQGTAGMRTHTVHRIKHPGDIEQRYDPPPGGEFLPRPGGDVLHTRHSDPFTHRNLTQVKAQNAFYDITAASQCSRTFAVEVSIFIEILTPQRPASSAMNCQCGTTALL
jgi:hypothetical protein